MRARQIIVGTSFPPATVQAMGQAFDAAWDSIAANFKDDAGQIEAARIALAKSVVAVATENGCDDVEVLKTGALQAMARDHSTPS